MKKIGLDNIYNCILGGAIGDALGVPVRDMTYDLIVEQYGKCGLTTMQTDEDNRARISANTQLNIFSIDALIRAYTKYYIYDITDMGKTITYTSYLRWQYAQGRDIPNDIDRKILEDNYLMDYQELKYERYAEDSMKHLLEGTIDVEQEGMNNNKGYACLTKSAIYGLVFYESDELAFEMAVKIAKITHGHPNAYLSCGVLAVIIANIARGEKLENAIKNAIILLKKQREKSELLNMLMLTFKLAKDNIHYPEKFDDFGLCDDAHETLCAAIYVCLIRKKDIAEGLLYAVNNNCYGNNVACVVGQILGLYTGLDVQTLAWIDNLELKELIRDISYDLYLVILKTMPTEIDNFDKELSVEEAKYVNEQNIANWWLIKYDKN